MPTYPEVTPLMQQWHAVKERHPDALVFFRVGDFYEMFMEDAREGSRLLGLTLTSRNNGAAGDVPLAGIPVRALDDYLARLVSAGRRVAICEQVEDPAEAKGIVRREVVETVTPGTVLHDRLLPERRNTFVAALAPDRDGLLGLAALDLSTGEFLLQVVHEGELADELGRLEPAELLLPREAEAVADFVLRSRPGLLLTLRDGWRFDPSSARSELQQRYEVPTLAGFGVEAGDLPAIRAAGALSAYIREIQPSASSHLRPPRILRPGGDMTLDEMTRRNLELVESLRAGEEGGTLVSVLDETVTAMGGRMLRRWILRPLADAEEIRRRLDRVEGLVRDSALRSRVRAALGEVADLERLAAKVGSGRVTPRELLSLARSLRATASLSVPPGGGDPDSRDPGGILPPLDPLREVEADISGALAPDAPPNLAEGGVVRPGHSPELDALRAVHEGAVGFIASLQARERERTGIPSLKVGYNRVFGYFLEVTAANLSRVPADYIRKQTLAGAERYFTPELKEWEEKVHAAEERIGQLEGELFHALRIRISGSIRRIQTLAVDVAEIDVLAGLAEVAVRRRYVRPELHSGPGLEIREGRHPVVETMMPSESFIPNDVRLDPEGGFIGIITGPNMAGKSTVLRQVGLIQLMAQMGSFVPAETARLGVRDRIFTRVGASDNLARGQSTFMVEMTETAAILHSATRRSLVLLDEIGRGTSTWDGVSIAWAVTESLHDRVGAATLFATHYHELTQLADRLPGVFNLNVPVRESGERLVFLRRLQPGGADRSWGIQVARLAGLPADVVSRARERLRELESTGTGTGGPPRSQSPGPPDDPQLALFDPAAHPVLRRLREVNPDELTPLEALHLLYGLVDALRRSPSGDVQ